VVVVANQRNQPNMTVCLAAESQLFGCSSCVGWCSELSLSQRSSYILIATPLEIRIDCNVVVFTISSFRSCLIIITPSPVAPSRPSFVEGPFYSVHFLSVLSVLRRSRPDPIPRQCDHDSPLNTLSLIRTLFTKISQKYPTISSTREKRKRPNVLGTFPIPSSSHTYSVHACPCAKHHHHHHLCLAS